MPELPEVETVMRGLAPVMEGARFERVEVRRAGLRFPFPPRFGPRLEGRRLISLRRRAKYILGQLDDGAGLLMHLGMTGRFMIASGTDASIVGRLHNQAGPDAVHEHVVFHMSGAEGAGTQGARIGFFDPRRFGVMDLAAPGQLDKHRLLKKIGIEPLGPDLDADFLQTAFAAKKAPLKAALLDQRIIAGLGNIYVCEALHRAGLSPMRAAGSIVGPRRGAMRARLVEKIVMTLGEAIEAGGSTLRDFAAADGSLGYFQHNFGVYDKEGRPCPNDGCHGTVRRIVQSGRSTFFCPECQK